MSLAGKFATVGGATLFSRVFGFGREMMMASALGIGISSQLLCAGCQSRAEVFVGAWRESRVLSETGSEASEMSVEPGRARSIGR